MKTRRFFAIVLTICLLIIGIPLVNVQASEILKVGDNATATLLSDGTVVYTGAGDLYDYEYNESPWYNNTSVKKVVIGNGITSIGNCTFSGCSNISSISLPNSLTQIGAHVFYKNTSLSSIVIPEGVTNLSDNVFFGCSNLKSVSLPQSMRNLGSGVFWKCSSLSDISFPLNLATIGNCTFYGCSSLTSITIPDSVTTIDVEAYKSCSNLSSVIIRGANTSLHYGCFSECSPELIIYGKQGSLAETYATNNSIRFQSLDGESENKDDENNIKNDGEYSLIYNENDFLKISDNPFGKYKLAKDITLYSTDSATYIDSFDGTLDGDGYTILAPGTALFKTVEKGAIVKNFNLELTRSSVKIVDNDFGPVAIYNNGTIENIETSGSVSQETSGWIGGIVGRNFNGTIKHCKNGVNYSIENSNADLFSNVLGGITARMNDDAQIIQCWNAGNLSLTIQDGANSTPQGNSNGGIVGMDTYVDIRECANSGKISTYYNNNMYSFTPYSSVGFISGDEYSVSNKSSNNEKHSIAESSCFISNDSSLNLRINSTYYTSVSRNISASDTAYTKKTLAEIEKWWDSLYDIDDDTNTNNVYYINSVDSNQIILDALPYGYDDSKVSIESIKPYVGKYAYIEFDTSASPKVIGIKEVKSSFGTITNYVELNSSGENDSIEIDQKEYPVSNKNISVIDGRNSRIMYHTIDDQIVGIEFLKTSIGYYNGTTENGEKKSITISNKEYVINSASCIADEIENGDPVVFSAGTKNNSDEICSFLLEVQKLQGTPSVWVYVSDDTFSTEIGQELDLYCALHIGDYVIPNWENPSFAVGNDKLVTLSNYEQTDLGYHCKIKGVAVGETSITITDTETGAHQSFPIRVKDKSESVPYSCLISEVPDYTIESGWDKGLQTNIYNVNGLYVNKYKYEKNEAGGYEVSFDVYNSLYMHGSVDVYDKDGRWIQSGKINKLTGITSIYSTGESLVYLIDDALQQKSLTYEATTYSKKTRIQITVPEDGYFVISTNYVDSPGVMLYNSIDIIKLGLDATVSSIDKVDCNLNLEKYLSDAKEKKLHEALQKAIDSKTKKFLSDQLKEGMTAGYEEAANVIVLQGNEVLTAEKLDDNFYKDTLGVGEDVLMNYMGPAGAALKLMFGIQKYADYTLQVGQICKGISKSEIVISATSVPSIHGITVKPDNPAAIGEAVLQVFRVSEKDEIVSSFENAIQTQTNHYEIFNICFTKDNVEQEINTNVTVRIPIPKTFDKNKSAIFRQEKDGSWTKLDSKIDGNYLVFETNHFSLYAIAESFAVNEPATTLISSITLNMTNGTVVKDGTLKLNATTVPSNATNPTLLWSSNTPSVATVDQTGLVTAVSVGKATITVKAQDGSGVEASCIVEVTGVSNNDNNNTDGDNSSDSGNSENTDNSNNDGNNNSGNNGGNTNNGENTNNGGNTDSGNNGGNTDNGNNDGNIDNGSQDKIPNAKKQKNGDKVKIGNTTYTIINIKKKEVSYTKTKSKASKLTIPPTVKISGTKYKVTKIADNAFTNNKRITQVIIGKNICVIGKNAFKGCTKLKGITLTENVKLIGANAFSGDKKLTTLTIVSNKLTKKGVKNSLKGSYIKTIRLKGAAKKSYKKFCQYFKKDNSGRSVKIKK